jgi:hypothetical protein
MAIQGIGMRSSFIGTGLLNIRDQLEDLQRQLGTGKKSETYAGLGTARSFAIGLRSQLSNLASYKDTIANVNTRLNIGNSVLERLIGVGANIKTSASGSSTQLENTGQTMAQVRARDSLAEMLQLLNIQSGDRYLFSGRATDTKAVAEIGDILEGAGAQAGLKQIIAERKQADIGAAGLGRLAITAPTVTSVEIEEEADPLPFGMKLNAITSSLTGATVAGPAGTPPAISVDFPVNPNAGDKVKFTFDMPDGTTEVIELTASTNAPPAAGEFAIGATSDLTATNFQTALTAAVGKLANSALVAASAMAASDNFFAGGASTVTGGAELNDNTGTAVAITGATLLAGAAGGASDNLSDNFQATDTIVVNGVTINFNSGGGTTGSATAGTLDIDVTISDVDDVLAAIDAITGTTIPSTVGTGADAGKVLLQTGTNQDLIISGSGLGRLGLSAGSTSVSQPLRVNGPPFDTATTLVAGTPANTVSWYTGETGTDPARGTAVARIDQSITVQYGARANEQGLRWQLQVIAAYAAVTTSTTDPNARDQVQALNDRTSANLAPQFGQQSIQDIQSEMAGAQGAMDAASDRQTLTTTMTQTMLDEVEGISNEETIAKILALQTNLQASYQVTSMLYQTTLVKFI